MKPLFPAQAVAKGVVITELDAENTDGEQKKTPDLQMQEGTLIAHEALVLEYS